MEARNQGSRNGPHRWWRVTAIVLVVVGLATSLSLARGGGGGTQVVSQQSPVDSLTTTSTGPTTSTTAPLTSTTTMTAATPAVPTLLTKEFEGLRIEVVVHTPDPLTAQILRLSVKASDKYGAEITGGADFGDGPGGGVPTPAILECKTRTSPVAGPRAERAWEITHSYRIPGPYKLQVVAASASCDQGDKGRTVAVTGVISVGKGLVLGNGPALPSVTLKQMKNVREPGAALINIGSTDADGFVRRVELDWGDGSPRFVHEVPVAECFDPIRSWASSEVLKAPTHRYATPGETYTARATITSIACSGSEAQTATATTLVTAP